MRREQTRPDFAHAESSASVLLEDSSVVATILVSPQGSILGANTRMRALLDPGAPGSPGQNSSTVRCAGVAIMGRTLISREPLFKLIGQA